MAQTPAELTPFFLANLGKPTAFSKGKLSKYLEKLKVKDKEIGGALGTSISESRGGIRARYFVIHDTSDEVSGPRFPGAINDATYGLNRLDKRDVSMAHVMISRPGDSRTGQSYAGELTATKFEQRYDNAAGLFLHHELVQPRIRGGFAFHAVGPGEGFTVPQMKRLALLYVIASARQGNWMIPAFHAALDEGIPDGNDDPQNFNLAQWQNLVEQVNAEVTDSSVIIPKPEEKQPKTPTTTPGSCRWYAVASCNQSEAALLGHQRTLGGEFKIVHTDSISGFARGWYCLVSESEDHKQATAIASSAKSVVSSSYVKKGCPL